MNTRQFGVMVEFESKRMDTGRCVGVVRAKSHDKVFDQAERAIAIERGIDPDEIVAIHTLDSSPIE